MMPKIAMIGAGSIVFCKTLMMDIMNTPSLRGSHIALMNRGKPKLDRIEAFAHRMVKDNNLPTKISATLSRREALEGADYVIIMIDTGGLGAFRHDYLIPLKYGVDQCIGDTLTPGGIMRAARSIPVLVDIAKDMKELCPDATMLNYTNPMAPVCWALGEAADISFVGLCHGVQATLDLIARFVNVKKEDIDFVAAGINHMAWFLKLEKNGRDLYPKLWRMIEKPEYYLIEKVRCETMRHFGYFMTESTGHLSEYLPYFRKNKKALETYCDQPAFGGESGAYYKWATAIGKKFAKTDPLKFESTKLEPRSAEYCSYIIEAMETDEIFRLNGNIRNNGLISNLPHDCCAEVPIYVDRNGIHPSYVGALPPQCAAANMMNVNCQRLAVQASLTGDPELLFAAMAMDPLTSSVCTLHEIREMTSELLEAQRKWLPQFGRRKLKPRKPIVIPKGTKGVTVPADPALAIGQRFVNLIEMKTGRKR